VSKKKLCQSRDEKNPLPMLEAFLAGSAFRAMKRI
jgi:hypothetical protein